jgi:nitrite reductase (NADH) small subunit
MRASRDTGDDGWQPVCRAEDLDFERGVAALVHGQAIALFRMPDGQVYALGNHDPFSRTSVLARGIVGQRAGVPFVGSPVHRHAFDLRTGQCLDVDQVSVPAYEVRIADGVVLVGPRRRADPAGTGVGEPPPTASSSSSPSSPSSSAR